jgi:hypothetical protein
MRLFYRRSADEAPVPGLAQTAAASGWRPAADQPLDRDLTDELHDIALDMHGVGRGIDNVGQNTNLHVVAFRDAFCFDDGGRPVTVANARAVVDRFAQVGLGRPMDVALCAVELPALLRPGVVYSRRYHLHLHMRENATGNALFDEQYVVAGLPSSVGDTWLTPPVQQLILAHDDWVLMPFGSTLVCLSKGPFTSADDVVRRVHDVLQLVAAVPTSVLPEHTDHSVDDLAARIARIGSIDEALAFLGQLSEDDRTRLARSDTPLADFADVRTPEEAVQRLQSLDRARQMQLMAMFMR